MRFWSRLLSCIRRKKSNKKAGRTNRTSESQNSGAFTLANNQFIRPGSFSSLQSISSSIATSSEINSLFEVECPLCFRSVNQSRVERHIESCITQTPRIPYNNEQLLRDSNECVICLDEMLAGESVARLPCLCIYHIGCIEEWLKHRNCCPEHPDDF